MKPQMFRTFYDALQTKNGPITVATRAQLFSHIGSLAYLVIDHSHWIGHKHFSGQPYLLDDDLPFWRFSFLVTRASSNNQSTGTWSANAKTCDIYAQELSTGDELHFTQPLRDIKSSDLWHKVEWCVFDNRISPAGTMGQLKHRIYI
jgi:hypothetical protein